MENNNYVNRMHCRFVNASKKKNRVARVELISVIVKILFYFGYERFEVLVHNYFLTNLI